MKFCKKVEELYGPRASIKGKSLGCCNSRSHFSSIVAAGAVISLALRYHP